VTDQHEYTGCPGCGEMEDRDCRCTGADYEPKNKLQALLIARSEPIRCTCTDERDLGCPKHGVQIVRLTENSVFDFAVWGDRPPAALSGVVRRRPRQRGRRR
jgi:hypothetical protein